MDLMKEFELYLPEWAEQNNKPIPNINKMNKLWTAAWESFMKDKLIGDWQQRKDAFMSIQLLTKTEMKKRERQKNLQESLESNVEQPSGWDKIKKYMK